MMSNEKNQYWTDDPEKVEQYVLGRFTQEEMKRLDAEIADYEEGKALIRQEMELAAGIRRHGRDRMKSELRKRLKRERNAQFYSFQYIGMAAAVLIIAVGIGLYQIWFSDLIAPKQFHQQQIIITSKQDTALNSGEKTPKREASRETATADRAEELQKKDHSSVSRSKDRVASTILAEEGKETAVTEVVVPAPVAAAEQTSALASGGPSQLWLIGNVVMIGDAAVSTSDRIGAAPSMKQNSRRSSSSSESIALQKAKANTVIVRRRSVKELPSDRAQSSRGRGQVESLLERDEEKLVLTLFDDSMDETDLKDAVVETFTENTLVVTLPNQRITYQLPSGWNQTNRSR